MFPPGKRPPSNGPDYRLVAEIGEDNAGYFSGYVKPPKELAANATYNMPCVPYRDPALDALYMTLVVGTATIAAGVTTVVTIEPTMGCFSGYYVEIYAVDTSNPQSRQRVLVGQFSMGDCPGDCRTAPVFSDVFEADHACCNGRPLRWNFGKIALGTNGNVSITNPNGAGSVDVQVIVRGYCHRGSCAC